MLSGNNGGEVYVASPSERRASRQHRVSRSNLGHTPDQAALAASALRLLGKVFCYHKVILYSRGNTVTMVGGMKWLNQTCKSGTIKWQGQEYHAKLCDTRNMAPYSCKLEKIWSCNIANFCVPGGGSIKRGSTSSNRTHLYAQKLKYSVSSESAKNTRKLSS